MFLILLSSKCTVICKDDVVKYMLSMLILSGRIGKWILALLEFDLCYKSAKEVKGQVMADFVTQHVIQWDHWKLLLGRFSLMDLHVIKKRVSVLC